MNWKIGHKQKLGSDACGPYSVTNEIAPEEGTTWKYYKDGDWMTITSNIFGSLGMYISSFSKKCQFLIFKLEFPARASSSWTSMRPSILIFV